jgi:hypothetical protein
MTHDTIIDYSNFDITNSLTHSHSMQQNPSWETNSHSASQKIPLLLWNRRFITVFTTAATGPYT